MISSSTGGTACMEMESGMVVCVRNVVEASDARNCVGINGGIFRTRRHIYCMHMPNICCVYIMLINGALLKHR